MDKYLEAEKRLYDLLGLKVFRLKVDGVEHGSYLTDIYDNAPKYCRDDAAAFSLMVEHDIKTIPGTPGCIARTAYAPDIVVCAADHGNDKATAVRYAIVQAVISKLSQQSN